MVRLDTLCCLLGKHANDPGSDFVTNYGLVIFADDVDTRKLSMDRRRKGIMVVGRWEWRDYDVQQCCLS